MSEPTLYKSEDKPDNVKDDWCLLVVPAGGGELKKDHCSVFLHPGPEKKPKPHAWRVGMLIVYASFRELMWAQSFSAGPSLRFMVLTR